MKKINEYIIFFTLFPVQWKVSLIYLNNAIAKHNEDIRTNAVKLKMITQKEYRDRGGASVMKGVMKCSVCQVILCMSCYNLFHKETDLIGKKNEISKK